MSLQGEKDIIPVSVQDIIEQLDATSIAEKQARIDVATERSMALGMLVRQLVLQNDELVDVEVTNSELLLTIQKLLGEMGLSGTISIGRLHPTYSDPMDEETAKALGNRIKNHRIELGLTQEEFAARYGLSSRYQVFRAEKGIGRAVIKVAATVLKD